MRKIIKKARMISLALTLLTTIPLFINYLRDTEVSNSTIIDLHVWFGLSFFILAITSMIMNHRKHNK